MTAEDVTNYYICSKCGKACTTWWELDKNMEPIKGTETSFCCEEKAIPRPTQPAPKQREEG